VAFSFACHRDSQGDPQGFTISGLLPATEETMLTGSMETVPSSYLQEDDSGVLLDHEDDFGFIVVSQNQEEEEDDDELASTGILIIGPSRTLNLQPRAPPVPIENHSLSPRLSLPDSGSLPTDLHSLHLDSVRTPSFNSSTSSVGNEEHSSSSSRNKTSQRVYGVHTLIMAGLLVVLGLSLCFCMVLLLERHSWVQSNQKLEDQMNRMQSDWVNLATKWQKDQEASMATSRSIKASLQAQVEEQRRKIEEIYQEQREYWEKREQEKAEKERQEKEKRAQKENVKRLKEQQRREDAARKTIPPSSKPQQKFSKKKSFFNDSNYAKGFEEVWSDTEEAILKWSDETHHKVRNLLNGLGTKVWKATDGLLNQVEYTFEHVRVKITQAWSNFYTIMHQPKEGFMEKAAPVVTTFLFATAAAALTEGTNRFVRYMQDDEE